MRRRSSRKRGARRRSRSTSRRSRCAPCFSSASTQSSVASHKSVVVGWTDDLGLVTDDCRMMLAYKAWRESRTRFVLSAGALLWFCSLFVLVRHGVRVSAERPYADFVAGSIYGGGIRTLYTIFVVLLGLGGLVPERAYGSAG